jgi:hypothetical protein
MEKYPNMDNVLFKYNVLSNNQLLAQINNRNCIDEFFLYTILKNIREIEHDDEMKNMFMDNFKNLIRTVPGDHDLLFQPDEFDLDFDDIDDENEQN